ncbi:MAG: P1 family peptidase [Sphingomonadales bacterium]
MRYFILLFFIGYSPLLAGDDDPRAREAGIAPGIYETGRWNAITDVEGVLVGQVSISLGDTVRTGMTAILPHSENIYLNKVPAGYSQGNGYGKMMGTTQVIELGEIETPILLTTTLSVPDAASGIINWTLALKGNEEVRSVNAVVGETNDGGINDIRGRHLKDSHAIEAIERATSGPVEEGVVGAGMGTRVFGWKGGIGTSSRVLPYDLGGFTIGVIVQTNYGGNLEILGVPIDYEIRKEVNMLHEEGLKTADGSVMIIIATDAPVSDRNLSRMAKRAFIGIGKTGSPMSNGSGDYALAFSTADSVRRTPERRNGGKAITDWPNNRMTPLFQAVAEATEEAVYNSMFKAHTVDTEMGRQFPELPVRKVLEILRSAGKIK